MNGYILVLIVGGLGIFFSILAARAFGQWHGIWRWAAVLPIFLMVAVTLYILVATTLDPTSHNLWPIELLFWYVVAGLMTSVLALLRWINHRIVLARQYN